MLEGLITGKLHARAAERFDRNGNPYATVTVKVPQAGSELLFVHVAAFDRAAAAALLELDQGDAVAITGSLTPKAWTDSGGNARPSLDMVATRVLSVFQMRRKRKAATLASEDDEPADAGLADTH